MVPLASLKERADIARVIGETVDLRRSGSVLKGRSPWHSDSDPSFVVWPDRGRWRDYSAGGDAGGDVFDFIMRRDGVTLVEAANTLAAMLGEPAPFGVDDWGESDSEARTVRRVLTAAAEYYHSVLPGELRAHLNTHYGLSDETLERYQVGYADGRLHSALRSLRAGVHNDVFSREELLLSGLFSPQGSDIKDFFVGRLVFPYWHQRDVAYMIARAIEGPLGAGDWARGKYIKLRTRSESAPYVSDCVKNDVLFGVDCLRDKPAQVLITEGITDAMAAAQAGYACISPVTTSFRDGDIERIVDALRHTPDVVVCNDTEASAAGEKGARKTAQALFAAGVAIRVAHLPSHDGSKVDVNSFLRDKGAESFKNTIDAAVPWLSHLVLEVQGGRTLAAMRAELSPIAAQVSFARPTDAEDAKKAAAKIGVTAREWNALVKESRGLAPKAQKPKRDAGRDDAPTEDTERARGYVFERGGVYCVEGFEGEPVAISSFTLRPVRRLLLSEGEMLEAVPVCRGRDYSPVQFRRKVWNSRRDFVSVFKPLDLTWSGTDDNVQSLQGLMSQKSVPTSHGRTELGLSTHKGALVWVSPAETISQDAEIAPPGEVAYVSTGGELERRMPSRPHMMTQEEEFELLRFALTRLNKINAPEVVLPIIGWFFASLRAPCIFSEVRAFPILCVWGTQGSGKTSIISDVFWPLMGVEESEPLSATATPFALLKMLSESTSIPVFIDEYKPTDMPKKSADMLHRMLRRTYKHEVETKGNKSMELDAYKITSPVVMAGETRPSEPAIVERIITASPLKDTLAERPEYVRAYRELRSKPLHQIAPALVKMAMGINIPELLRTSTEWLDAALVKLPHATPARVRDNLRVAISGLSIFRAIYADVLGAEPPIDYSLFVRSQVNDLVGESGAVKSGLDIALEMLSTLAALEKVQYGAEYIVNEGLLLLSLGAAHATYHREAKNHGLHGELLDERALRRQIEEEAKREGYVLEPLKRLRHDGRHRRWVVIDFDKAEAKGLNLDGFQRVAPSPKQTRWGD